MAEAGNLNHKDRLNRMNPAAAKAKAGDCLYDLINNFNALLAKLDAANLAGVGTNNVATLAVKLPEQR